MAKFGNKSLLGLSSCHIDIQAIFTVVVEYFDISIIEGARSEERQHSHWQKGRELKNIHLDPKIRDNWEVVNEDNIVTTKDGYEKMSRHQSFPSVAVDVTPYPSMWSDKEEMLKLIGVVNFVQDRLFDEGKITHKLENGYEMWGWDGWHWQIKR